MREKYILEKFGLPVKLEILFHPSHPALFAWAIGRRKSPKHTLHYLQIQDLLIN